MKRVLWAAMLACGISSAASAATEMAVTVDDLPTHGPMPPGMQRPTIAQDMISILKRRGVPEVYGFVNGRQVRDDPKHAAIVEMWHEAGLRLGNHTFSHLNLNRVTAAEYIADIKRNEAILAALAGPRWERVFRYPYLHEGDTPQKRDAVRRWLAAQGYQIAQVSVYFDDWAWNDAYARCMAQADEDAIEWLKRSFLDSAVRRLEWSRAVSDMVFGRQIRHILLLHLGAFDAVMLDALLGAYQAAGVKTISLQAAMRDPAYKVNPDIVWDGELTFLLQVTRAKKVAIPPDPPIPLEKLATLCR